MVRLLNSSVCYLEGSTLQIMYCTPGRHPPRYHYPQTSSTVTNSFAFQTNSVYALHIITLKLSLSSYIHNSQCKMT